MNSGSFLKTCVLLVIGLLACLAFGIGIAAAGKPGKTRERPSSPLSTTASVPIDFLRAPVIPNPYLFDPNLTTLENHYLQDMDGDGVLDYCLFRGSWCVFYKGYPSPAVDRFDWQPVFIRLR